jgi:hypothetical protein
VTSNLLDERAILYDKVLQRGQPTISANSGRLISFFMPVHIVGYCLLGLFIIYLSSSFMLEKLRKGAGRRKDESTSLEQHPEANNNSSKEEMP